MQTRCSTNKSPIKLSAVGIKLTRYFVYEWGKPIRQKPYRVILRSPLPRIHYYQSQAVTSKRNPSTFYQLTVEPLPQYSIGLVL